MCSECGGESLRWAGQCPHCKAWNTLSEFKVVEPKRGRAAAAQPEPSRAVPLTDPGLEAAAGTVSQVRECAARLLRLAKETGIPIFLVGHVTKEGSLAGPRVLEHMVDTVLYLEGDRQQEFRILRATKNRFGSTDEIGIFAMGGVGLEEVADPSASLVSNSSLTTSGTVVLAAVEGTRP